MRFVLMLLAALAMATPGLAAPAPSATVAPGRAVPDFEAALVGGGIVSDETLRGHWTVIEFWALWCEDSLADAKYSAALARAIAQDAELRFVTVHLDQRYGRWGSVEAFLADTGAAYPVALDPHRQLARAFGVSATPTYLVVDPKGVIRAVRRDLRKDEAGEGGVKRLIKDIAALRRGEDS